MPFGVNRILMFSSKEDRNVLPHRSMHGTFLVVFRVIFKHYSKSWIYNMAMYFTDASKMYEITHSSSTILFLHQISNKNITFSLHITCLHVRYMQKSSFTAANEPKSSIKEEKGHKRNRKDRVKAAALM